jgi:hypothetical protein
MSTDYPTQDNHARTLGAVAYYDEYVVRQHIYGMPSRWHFARYYFNAQGEEVGYFIPDLVPFNGENHLNVHEPPRRWYSTPSPLMSL